MENSGLNFYHDFSHFNDFIPIDYFQEFNPLNEENREEDYKNPFSDYIFPSNCDMKLENYINNKPKLTINEDIQNTLKGTEIKMTFFTENKNQKDKKIKFKIYKKIHSGDSYDLVQIKLQVHFINYLIGLANDAVKSFFEGKKVNIEFKKIAYSEKKDVFTKKKIKETSYKDIFYLKLSKKNKRKYTKENTNIDNYLSISNKYSLLRDFFDQAYLYIFEKFYYENESIINFQGLNILLSKSTKTFAHLLNKSKNEDTKNAFLIVVDRLYFKINKESNI